MTAKAANVRERPARRAYSLAEVGAMLGRSTRTVSRWHEAGIVPGQKVGRDVFVPAAWVDTRWPEPAEVA